MKTASTQLTAFLNAAKEGMAFDLWTITLQSGNVLRWTDADIDVLSNGNLFVRGPVITRDRVKLARGLEVDNLGLTLQGASQLIGGQTLPMFATLGGFDAAGVRLERAYFDLDQVLQGTLLMFVGTVADVTPSRLGAKLSVKSPLTQLQQQLPSHVYQAGCINNLFDENCGVSRAGNTSSGTVTSVGSGSNPVLGVAFSSYVADAVLNLGIAKFASGLNAGIARTVQAQYGSGGSIQIQFARPFPFTVATGDTLTVTAGCNKTVTTCGTRFNNLIRFRGQPFIPVPETVG